MSEHLLWNHLADRLRGHVAAFPGVAGICVLDLSAGRRLAIHADELFPAASTIKMHVLAHLFERAERGEIDLTRRVVVEEGARVPGSGVLSYLEDVEELTARDVAVLMIIVSDNTATNLCIDWATHEGINAMLRRLGLSQTMLRRKMLDHVAVARGEENVTTPSEVVRFLELLYRAEGLSAYVCEQTLRILKKPKLGYLARGLPDDVVLASKSGGMGRVLNDAAIVFLNQRPYAVCVMIKYGPANRYVQESLIADVARTVHETMVTLDVTTPYGRGLPPGFLD